ncbi:MAG: acetyl-CoA carboxylase biotin carboxyl carrier protein subunit [Pseudobdellovibrio sp.]
MSNEMKQIKIKINGIEKNVFAEVIDQKIWYKIDNQIFSTDIADLTGGSTTRRRIGAAKKTSNQILAPMPGKITKIFVVIDEAVQKSQALLVMEAMKMEYTLKSDLDTEVEKINVQVGDQVILGHMLMQLKKKEI